MVPEALLLFSIAGNRLVRPGVIRLAARAARFSRRLSGRAPADGVRLASTPLACRPRRADSARLLWVACRCHCSRPLHGRHPIPACCQMDAQNSDLASV